MDKKGFLRTILGVRRLLKPLRFEHKRIKGLASIFEIISFFKKSQAEPAESEFLVEIGFEIEDEAFEELAIPERETFLKEQIRSMLEEIQEITFRKIVSPFPVYTFLLTDFDIVSYSFKDMQAEGKVSASFLYTYQPWSEVTDDALIPLKNEEILEIEKSIQEAFEKALQEI